ncbi:hypothetical protein FEM48_Zijuj11G0095900 [Ziziphus jujuba var. spinosa]|uniref:Wall-associated receptor kinase galacturonan-binding domain-containing protein n=1 Tax=Ziziphus jujuba var. spinosa TaxID=714518 RepID=A0A978UI68_ZIZJJ|nr:hypothetical protein FEM48_Zijuj11G0095900 [Ziziphus jujuba var. spinosa]
MEMNKIPIHLLILMCLTGLASAKRCPDCGLTRVPYPLSTGPDCGDPQYKVRCNAGTLWFDTLNGSSYVITSINQLNQRFVIRPPGLADNKTCMAADFGSQGIILDDNLPFNITSSNTVVGMNCSSHVLQLSVNCTSSSPCHDYIKQNVVANRACGSLPFCCFFKTGGSINAYRIRVRKERCSAYESFVNLDASLPVNKWPEPGVEIEWALPEEPICKSSVDCRDLVNSVCLPYNGNRRCLCKTGYQWDPINGICQYLKCQNGRVCKKRKNKAPLIGDFNRDEEDVNLVVYMKRVLREERLMDAVDPVIKDGASNIELETMKALGSLAAACLDERRHNRPSMKQVADEIEYIISILSTGTEISTT